MKKTQRPPTKKEGCFAQLIIAALIVLAILGIRSCFFGESEPKEEEKEVIKKKEYTEMDALYFSRKCVENYLKNPGSAQFPSEGNVKKLNDSTFNVVSYVDAHNSYGALGRLHYVCLVILNPETENGRCENMQVAENE